MSQIIRFIFQPVKTADVEGQVKLSGDVFHAGCVICEEFRPHAGFFDLAFGDLDGAGGEVEACNLPARFGEGDDVCACAAADVEGATRGVGFDEFEDFGRVMPLSHGGEPK